MKTPVCMICTWMGFFQSFKLHQKHLSDYINYSSPPKLTNHQAKIQRLEQIVSGGKIPEGVWTIGKWPRGANLCHTLMGVLWKTVSETPFHPTNTLRVAVKVHFWTYSKYPLSIYGVPFSPNLIYSHSRLI